MGKGSQDSQPLATPKWSGDRLHHALAQGPLTHQAVFTVMLNCMIG